jgi:hypothetical protein
MYGIGCTCVQRRACLASRLSLSVSSLHSCKLCASVDYASHTLVQLHALAALAHAVQSLQIKMQAPWRSALLTAANCQVCQPRGHRRGAPLQAQRRRRHAAETLCGFWVRRPPVTLAAWTFSVTSMRTWTGRCRLSHASPLVWARRFGVSRRRPSTATRGTRAPLAAPCLRRGTMLAKARRRKM